MLRYGFMHEGKAYIRVGDEIYPLLDFAKMLDTWRWLNG